MYNCSDSHNTQGIIELSSMTKTNEFVEWLNLIFSMIQIQLVSL